MSKYELDEILHEHCDRCDRETEMKLKSAKGLVIYTCRSCNKDYMLNYITFQRAMREQARREK